MVEKTERRTSKQESEREGRKVEVPLEEEGDSDENMEKEKNEMQAKKDRKGERGGMERKGLTGTK